MFFIQRVLAMWYVAMFVLRFYKKDIPDVIGQCKHIVIKTIYDYDITFYYRREDVIFTQYRFLNRFKHHYKVHNVYVKFGDTAPFSLQAMDNVITVTINTFLFDCIDERLLVDKMINIYTKHLLDELKKK